MTSEFYRTHTPWEPPKCQDLKHIGQVRVSSISPSKAFLSTASWYRGASQSTSQSDLALRELHEILAITEPLRTGIHGDDAAKKWWGKCEYTSALAEALAQFCKI